ncbi:antitoxin [Pseudomonas sp. PB105]|uniref:type II toxin-antitoxin system RelB family antitoxin n=1 Tax=Pseudomonas TaxID=286 RepID=UPI000C149C50|nr:MULTISPECIES: antitoxin [Pseudomonas]KAE9650220.1 antitoxin [Pseudomonas sp. PB105]MBD8238911.1 antitoxin [Pseudomonas fluorescens]MDY0896743.1 antitoxin [Pseudomonas fluorescens]MVW98635.1 antitoxin [Pseudomonas sp. PB100]PIB64351.1 antitoxin [Pseudomonas sp. 2822-17]
MSIPLSPIVSEFETEEQAASYERWFRAKVQASIDDPRPSIPHDQVMAEMRALIESKRKERDASGLAARGAS